MPKKPRPKSDIDDEVIWQGTGTIIPSGEMASPRKVPEKHPIGFIWPKPKRKPRRRK